MYWISFMFWNICHTNEAQLIKRNLTECIKMTDEAEPEWYNMQIY